MSKGMTQRLGGFGYELHFTCRVRTYACPACGRTGKLITARSFMDPGVDGEIVPLDDEQVLDPGEQRPLAAFRCESCGGRANLSNPVEVDPAAAEAYMEQRDVDGEL